MDPKYLAQQIVATTGRFMGRRYEKLLADLEKLSSGPPPLI